MQVKGVRQAIRALQNAGVDANDLKGLMHEIGMLVVRAADVPVRSGRLKSTVRAGRGKTKAVVRAGGARAPYAGVVHYGNPGRSRANPFLTRALAKKRTAVFDALDHGIDKLLRKNGLK